ncbi:TonB-dependent receptor [Allosphingosinicella indica]|uniref:Outer membrane receptor proteins, mostly Fe transport n=1 Tax=Allosphingosinicella indica TaxID=941907 RepID=A0A1X7G018_9SPHN|nr:TonB-dependent receptor [Allosphingosinicella indica]SMF61695.1 Outer membrane receptor proteins, mostly Fe transport [Allosphingosinicella indica]
MRVRWLAICGVSLTGLAISSAQAQTADPAAAAPPPVAESSGPQLQDIVVTAQRREESATRVPISITVVGGESLAEKSVSNLQDMTLSIPNFQITKTGLTTQTFIRGIGSGNDPAFEQSVAQYVDGVSYGRAQLTRAPFFDVERIEVLRGPQSILFGKNSTAGAVSIITAQPTSELAAGLTSTFTPTFDQVETTAFVSGPLSDSLSGRIALRHNTDDGYVYNITKDRDEPRNREFAGRAMLAYEGAGFRANLKGEYSRFNSTGRELEVVFDVPTRAIPAGPLAGTPLTYGTALNLQGLTGALVDTEFNYRRQAELPEFDRTRLANITLTTDTDIGDSVLTTVTGYLDYKRNSQFDLDFTAANIIGGNGREGYDQFSQEIRFVTPAEAQFSFVGGLYYEHNTLDYLDITGLGPNLAQLGFGVIANVGVRRDFRQKSDSYAAFGQVTFRATDALRLIGGVRITRDEKEATRLLVARAGQFDYNGAVITAPAVIGTLQAGLGFSLENPGGAGHDIAGERGRTRFTPSVTVEYDVSPDVLTFASYKEGYKGGGFNARANNNANFVFDDETVSAWEAGIRARIAGNRGSVGLTAYRATYSDLQISQFDGTVGFNVGNAGRTRAQGFEADMRYAVADGVTLGGALSYLDFKYLDFRRGNCAFGEVPDGDVVNGVRLCDYTGRRGRFTPKWNLSGSLAVDRPLTDSLNIRGALDASYKSAHNVHDNLDALGRVDGYAIVDARLGVGTEHWDVAVIGKNLLDENFLTFSANVPFASSVGANTQYASTSRGRSLSLQFSLRY